MNKALLDISRKNLEFYFDHARKRISPQTGFLHLYYDDLQASMQHTIPFMENLCYALALFRTRMADHTLLGRQLLTKLLPFEVDGNFPLYLHQYPECRDPFLSIYCLAPLFYLLTDCKTQLGEELFPLITSLAERIACRAHNIEKERALPFAARVRLEAYEDNIAPNEPKAAKDFGEYLLALSMRPDSALSRSELTRMAKLWNSSLSLFIAESRALAFDGYHVKPSLADLFLSSSLEKMEKSKELFSMPLIYPFDLDLPFRQNPIEVIHPEKEKRAAYLFIKDGQQIRSLCIDVANGGSVEIKTTSLPLKMIATMPENLAGDDDSYELSIYVDTMMPIAFQVNGVAATTFNLCDTLSLSLDEHLVEITFDPCNAEDKFFGHLMRQSRPSQHRKEGFYAFDHKICLRTLKRGSACSVGIQVEVKNKPTA